MLVRTTSDIPESQQHNKKHQWKCITLELLHACFGHHSCHSLLTASNHNVWQDITIWMATNAECVSCKISTVWTSACKFVLLTPCSAPGKIIYMDILPAPCDIGLTPKTAFTHMIIFVDAFSMFSCITGLHDKSSDAVAVAIRQFASSYGLVDTFGFLNISKVKVNASTQFTSVEFKAHCHDQGLNLSLMAPKYQSENHFAKSTWQSIQCMVQGMLVHAHLPDSYLFYALTCAAAISNILPIRNLVDAEGAVATPSLLFLGFKPLVSPF